MRHSSRVGHSHQVGRIMGATEVVASCARLSSSGVYWVCRRVTSRHSSVACRPREVQKGLECV